MKGLTTARRRRVAAAALAAGVLGGVAFTGSPALAADGAAGGGGVGDVYTPTSADEAQSRLTDLYTKLQAGSISPETYAAAQKRLAPSTGDAVASSPQQMPPPDEQGPPSTRTLSVTHYGQIKGFYCGPASGAMIVKMINGGKKSAYNGAGFSQTSFAGSAHMNTDNDGATTWGSGNFARGVNRWIGSNAYQQVNAPSAAKVKSALVSAIGVNARPVAADTVEFAGGAHYNGHPTNQTIGHWIVAYGYSNSGGTVKFADPSTTVWSGVNKKFEAKTAAFTQNYLQSNGIAY